MAASGKADEPLGAFSSMPEITELPLIRPLVAKGEETSQRDARSEGEPAKEVGSAASSGKGTPVLDTSNGGVRKSEEDDKRSVQNAKDESRILVPESEAKAEIHLKTEQDSPLKSMVTFHEPSPQDAKGLLKRPGEGEDALIPSETENNEMLSSERERKKHNSDFRCPPAVLAVYDENHSKVEYQSLKGVMMTSKNQMHRYRMYVSKFYQEVQHAQHASSGKQALSKSLRKLKFALQTSKRKLWVPFLALLS